MFELNPEKAISFDFDGTINPYSQGWNGGRITDEPFPGVKDFIQWFKDEGFQIIIFTARFHDTRKESIGFDMMEEVTGWLNRYDIPYDHVTGHKLPSICYIDDRSLHFIPGDWERMKQQAVKLSKYDGRNPVKEI